MDSDITGQRFGLLLVVGQGEKRHRHRLLKVLCDCGSQRQVLAHDIRSGKQVSCGCHRRGQGGHSGTAIYRRWASMVRRCTDTGRRDWSLYGGRGIKVCPQWAHDFQTFLRDVGLPPTPSHSLDRINNEGHYEPGNVRWATASEQAKNRRERQRDRNGRFGSAAVQA